MLLRLCITTANLGIGMTAINKTIKTNFHEERVKTAYRKCWHDSSCQIKRADPALSFKAS